MLSRAGWRLGVVGEADWRVGIEDKAPLRGHRDCTPLVQLEDHLGRRLLGGLLSVVDRPGRQDDNLHARHVGEDLVLHRDRGDGRGRSVQVAGFGEGHEETPNHDRSGTEQDCFTELACRFVTHSITSFSGSH